MSNDLAAQWRKAALDLGADLFGIADLTPAHDFIVAQGNEAIGSFPRSLTMGIRLMDSLVDDIANHDDKVAAWNYRAHAYDLVNARLNDLASRMASMVQEAGYRAMPIPATGYIYDGENYKGIYSHKVGAHLAGLAWIGKSCLAVTPEYGPRVRWCTVLIDAPVEPTGEPMEQRCGDCMECVNICPVGAYTGENYRDGEPREVRMDPHKCGDYMAVRAETVGVSVCGLCLYACPYGKAASKKLSREA